MNKVQAAFPATMDHLYGMLAFVCEFALREGLGTQDLDHLQLAAEEALVNIISYAYPQKSEGEVEITCESTADRPGVKITLQDCGEPFNPLERLPIELPTSQEVLDEDKNRVGGYGIYILVGLMDGVEYRREENKNRLVLTKYATKILSSQTGIASAL